jgi:hypothetical protein
MKNEKVIRYALYNEGYDDAHISMCNNGEYVSYSDYLLLKSRIEDLEDTISDLRYEERFRDTRD